MGETELDLSPIASKDEPKRQSQLKLTHWYGHRDIPAVEQYRNASTALQFFPEMWDKQLVIIKLYSNGNIFVATNKKEHACHT